MTAAAQPRPGAAAPRPGFMQVVALARDAVAFLTELPIDQVASCRGGAEGWTVVVDVVEAAARSGDNDLLASYRIALDPDGAVTGIERLRRYHREDAEPGP